METALIVIVALCVGVIALGRKTRRHALTLVAGTVLVYLVALIAWWSALYAQTVPVYRWLAEAGFYRTEGLIGGLIFFAPPLLLVAVFWYVAGGARFR